jgi:hypothetical protein
MGDRSRHDRRGMVLGASRIRARATDPVAPPSPLLMLPAAARAARSRAVILGAVAAVLVLASCAVAQASTTYFGQGQDPASRAYKPKMLGIAGEGSFVIEKMHWSFWGHRSARGRGTGAQDDCEPDCATGTFHRAPARVRLWRPRRKCGHEVWTRMTLFWLHGPPSGIPGYSQKRRVQWGLAQFPCE